MCGILCSLCASRSIQFTPLANSTLREHASFYHVNTAGQLTWGQQRPARVTNAGAVAASAARHSGARLRACGPGGRRRACCGRAAAAPRSARGERRLHAGAMRRLLLGALACLACLAAAYANDFYEVGVRHGTDKARSANSARHQQPAAPSRCSLLARPTRAARLRTPRLVPTQHVTRAPSRARLRNR